MNKPKPTGEWTADYVWNLRNNELEADQAIADAHNAALAAAWRKGHADAQAPALDRIEELHKQLANLQSQMDTAQQNYIRRLNELNQELDDLRKVAQIRPLQ